MFRFASSSIVPKRCNGTFSEEVDPPVALFSVGLSIDQAYSVGMGPAAIALRRMPYLPHSAASDIVIAWTADLAIADGTTKAEPVHTQVVSVETTDPGNSSAIHRRPTACVVLKEPFITVEVIASNARELMSLV